MPVRIATLILDITTSGAGRAVAAVGRVLDQASRAQKVFQVSAATLLKMWAAFRLLTSQSAIAASIFDEVGQIFGFIVDSLLGPFLPLIEDILDVFWAFSDWVEQKGPEIKAILFGLFIGLGAVILGVSGPVAALGALIVAVALLIYTHWNSIVEAIRGAVAAIMTFIQPLLDAIGFLDRTLAGGLIGALLGGAAGFMIGGPIGAWLGATAGYQGGSTVNNVTTHAPINVSTTGDTAGGMGAGVALRSQLAMDGRLA
jgi:hypothetical protein